MGLFDFTKHDADAPAAEVDDATRLELRRVANLFLLSSHHALVLPPARSSRGRCT